jgi:two-component system, chemotaxis family, sensor kinase CheA
MNAPTPVETFLIEARDLLDQIEEIALDATQRPVDVDAINRLFRAFHTIKGSGAMFGFEAVAAFTHHVENALDQVRSGAVAVSPRLMELILAARDHIAQLLEDKSLAGSPESAALVTAFHELVNNGANTGRTAPSAPPPPAAVRETWRIRFQPAPRIAASGLNPVSLLDELRDLGDCVVTALTEGVPPLEQLHAEQCHFGWEIRLTTDRGLNAIKDVFIFVEDESELVIEAVTAAPHASAPAAPPPSRRKPVPLRSTREPAHDASVRVPSARLDRLVNLVGELVMNQSRLTQFATRADEADLTITVEELERLIAELRDTVLGIRMMPIGTTFSRFKRLVHDLSGELHKEMVLVTEGAETELDKTVIDQLGDPLVHLIRNSIDHGIEPPDERARLGKPRQGTIRLAAAHVGSHVVITIQDDGRGLDVEALRAKAVEKKLIADDANLSERELFNLILLPGFSTAKQVTNLSGRGVGMDVVKREIDALGGSIQIASERGQGTTISATLPLTLAIIDGLLVGIGGDQFIIPMSAVQENVELARGDRSRHNGRNIVSVRGELIPYVWLRGTFDVAGEEPEIEKVVIVRQGNDRVGLVVDRVLGSHQTVIQSLGRFYRGIEVLSGATIMGDGRVALILDVPGLVRFVEKSHAAQQVPAA